MAADLDVIAWSASCRNPLVLNIFDLSFTTLTSFCSCLVLSLELLAALSLEDIDYLALHKVAYHGDTRAGQGGFRSHHARAGL